MKALRRILALLNPVVRDTTAGRELCARCRQGRPAQETRCPVCGLLAGDDDPYGAERGPLAERLR